MGTHPLAHTGKPHCVHRPPLAGCFLGHWSMSETEVRVVRVLTVDDQVVFRQAARDVISATAGFEPVGDVGSGEQAVAAVERLRPELVLLDVRMPGIGGIEAARRIKEAHPGTVVVLISIEDSDEFAEDARAVGRGGARAQAGLRPGTSAQHLGRPRRTRLKDASMTDADATTGAATPAVPPRQFLALLLLAAVVGLVVSLASWCFLQLVHYMPEWVYEDLPDAVGYEHGAPLWWYLPACAFAGLVVAFAIVRLPGRGGHIPAHGLNAGPTQPIDLPGVMLAAVAALGLGLVLGPEAPLLALGGGLGDPGDPAGAQGRARGGRGGDGRVLAPSRRCRSSSRRR